MQEQDRLPRRRLVLRGAILAAVVTIAAVAFYAREQHLEKTERTRALAVELIRTTVQAFDSVDVLTASERSSLRTYRNKDHLQAAETYGISGIASRSDAEELTRDRRLVRIQSNPLYRIEPLDYSIPFLTPSAANLLDRIAHRFQTRLGELGLPPFRFVVTSVTRSREDQRALRQVNVNAATKSSHEYGTTFDLHYEEFDYVARPVVPDRAGIYEAELVDILTDAYDRLASERSAALKAVLGNVLLDLQEENDAMVIYERRQPVYHVTVSQPIPEAPPRLHQDGSEENLLLRTAP